MPLYIFYPYRPDGCAATWLSAELEGDETAVAYGQGILAAHSSAISVSIFQGERKLTRVALARKRDASALDRQTIRNSRASIGASRELLERTAAAVGVRGKIDRPNPADGDGSAVASSG